MYKGYNAGLGGAGCWTDTSGPLKGHVCTIYFASKCEYLIGFYFFALKTGRIMDKLGFSHFLQFSDILCRPLLLCSTFSGANGNRIQVKRDGVSSRPGI